MRKHCYYSAISLSSDKSQRKHLTAFGGRARLAAGWIGRQVVRMSVSHLRLEVQLNA